MSNPLPSHPSSPETRHGLGPLSSNEIVIGLALGSPTENPLASMPGGYLDGHLPPSLAGDRNHEIDYSDNVSRISYNSPPGQPARSHRPRSGLKRSGSRWKNLGGLFTRKAPSAPSFDGQPFYMLDRPNQQDWAMSAHTPAPPERLAAPPVARTPTAPASQSQTLCSAEASQESGARAMLRRVSTRRKGIRKRARAQTIGSLETSRRSPAKARLEDPGVPDERAGAATWLRLDDREDQKVPAAVSSVRGKPSLLQVDIPSVELERYSIMFGDLLLPKSTKSPPLPSSRRQSKLREPKPVSMGKENMPEELSLSPLSSNPPLSSNLPRPPHTRKDSSSSAGSKSSTKSGNYGLFPSPGPAQKRKAAHKAAPKPSPLSRSVTTPTVTTASLSRPVIQTSESHDPNQLMIVIHEAETLSPSRAHSDSGASGHHRRTSSFNSSDFSDSSTRASYFEYIDDLAKNEDPRPSSASGPRREALTRSAFPVRKSSMKAPRASPVTPRTTRPPVPVEHSSLRKAPEPIVSDEGVSIARQISISRRQRNLVPVMPQAARQQMQAKPVESCSTSALRKSHHLTFEAAVDKC